MVCAVDCRAEDWHLPLLRNVEEVAKLLIDRPATPGS